MNYEEERNLQTGTGCCDEEKLEILRELMNKEDIEKFVEKEEAKKAVMSE